MVKSPKILIIEDSAFERNLMIKLLNDAGYNRITQVAYGEEGIEKFKSEKPDLVLLDLILPTMQGGDILRTLAKLKKINSRTKVIIITIITPEEMGQNGKFTIQEAMELGASDWILKSNFTVRLIPAVRKVLEGK